LAVEEVLDCELAGELQDEPEVLVSEEGVA